MCLPRCEQPGRSIMDQALHLVTSTSFYPATRATRPERLRPIREQIQLDDATLAAILGRADQRRRRHPAGDLDPGPRKCPSFRSPGDGSFSRLAQKSVSQLPAPIGPTSHLSEQTNALSVRSGQLPVGVNDAIDRYPNRRTDRTGSLRIGDPAIPAQALPGSDLVFGFQVTCRLECIRTFR